MYGLVQPIEITRLSDRHFWHGGYDKAEKANKINGGILMQIFFWVNEWKIFGLVTQSSNYLATRIVKRAKIPVGKNTHFRDDC